MPGGVGVAALHFCVCVCTHYHVRCSCHSDPTLKASPMLRCLLEVRLVLPCSRSGPCFSMEDGINDTKLQPQRPSKLAGGTLVAARGHSWSLMVKRVYPAKQKAMTLWAMKRKEYVGEASSRGKWNEVKGKNFFRKKQVAKNVQTVSRKMKTRSKQVTDWQESQQKLTLLIEILRKAELSCVKFDSSVKLMRSVWQVTCLSLKQSP